MLPPAHAVGDRTPALGLDPRALACSRIGLGLLAAADGLFRLTDAQAMYSDRGVLPRAAAVQHFDFLLDHAFSLHMAGGSLFWAVTLLCLQVLAGLSLAVGWRTRTSALLLYLLLAGVQLRNLFVGGGYDAMLRLCVLWAALAPVSRVWSVDAVHHPPADPEAPATDLGSLGLFAQVVIVYVAAGYAKLAEPTWRSGEALELILQAEFHTRPLGHILAGFPALCSAITSVTGWVEVCWPLVFLVPLRRGPVRTAVLAALALLTLSFLLVLYVDFFPLVAVVGLSALVPAWAFDRLGLTVERLAPTGLAERLPAGVRSGPWSARMAQLAAVPLLLFTLVWNAGVAQDPQYTGAPGIRQFGQALFLQQGWQMFGRPASRSGWVTVTGRTFAGEEVDLLALGGPTPRDRPARSPVSSSSSAPQRPYRNMRWMLLLKRIAYGQQDAASEFSRYHCREWNRGRDGDQRLSTLEIAFYNHPIPDPQGMGVTREVVWDHGCYR